MKERLEYAAAWLGLKLLGALPRGAARWVGAAFVSAAFAARSPLRRAAEFNLRLAFPDWSAEERERVIRGMVRQVGWMAGEFSQFPKYTREKIEEIVALEGQEFFEEARERGKGVVFLTGHMSAWELAPFAHARYGFPLHFLVRPVKNARVDEMINHYRCLSGNIPIEKNRSARAILKVLAEGGTVGILADHNTSWGEGVFVNFFGVPACTTSGLARVALRTDAAVVPGFLAWDDARKKYRLEFGRAVELVRTGDEEADVAANTQKFTAVVEAQIRKHPEQWVWAHKRWKTRPPGEKPLYDF